MKTVLSYRGLILRKRDGFQGEKQIIIPKKILQQKVLKDPVLSRFYIKLIGFFPKATFHYRERRFGCEDNIFIYCLSGKGWYQNKSGIVEVKANEFIIIPATTQYLRYGADAKDPWTICWVHFCGDYISHFNKTYNIDKFLNPTLVVPDEKKISLWEEMYYALENGYSNDNLSYSNFCLYHFIASFIFPSIKSANSEKNENNIITQAIQFMRENLHKRLKIVDFAKKTPYSNSHFSSLFRKEIGISPIDYFIQLKIQKACQLLDFTNKKVKDIATQVGYDDPYHFNRIFHKLMSTSPTKYRSMKKG
jgi:AraC-like DNA-binding protein